MRAETDKKYSEVTLNIKALSDKIDGLPRPIGFWQLAGMIASGLVVAFTLLGVFADRFDGGISAYGTFDAFFEEQREVDAGQSARIDKILEVLEAQSAQSPTSPAEGQD